MRVESVLTDIAIRTTQVTICAGLSVLAKGVCDRLKGFEELVEGEEATSTRLEMQLLGKMSEQLLPSLFKLVDTLHNN